MWTAFDKAKVLKICIVPAMDKPVLLHRLRQVLILPITEKKLWVSARSVSYLLKIPRVRILSVHKFIQLQSTGLSCLPLAEPIQCALDFSRLTFKEENCSKV